MNPQQPPTKIQLTNASDFHEGYANSVQVRVSLWDFYLMFGIMNQTSADSVTINNHHGIYLSPQQAKALANVLNQNVSQYEATFGEIRLEPKPPASSVQ
jgi:flagellar protein FlaG